MCGRLALTLPPESVAHLFDAVFAAPDNLEPRYNVCPTTQVLTAVSTEDGRVMQKMRWGLLPHWYKTPARVILLRRINSYPLILSRPQMNRAARSNTQQLFDARY